MQKKKRLPERTAAWIIGAILLALMLLTAASCVAEEVPPKDAIGATEAQKIALQHAGLQESEVRMDRADYDFDDGVPEYEIEFRKDKTEYEYIIHALTGEVLHHHAESVYD